MSKYGIMLQEVINMAGMKVFISSTCYDLSVLRAELRNFVASMGYEPVMSEFADVVFDPRIHTHVSCTNEVANCDMMVVIIGSRFGGRTVPETLKKLDISKLKTISKDSTSLSDEKNISITQMEVYTAIEKNIPIYTFVEKKVYHDHNLYEKNKDKDCIKEIIFPSIEKQDSAPYIFEFLNFIRQQNTGNCLFEFERLQEIEETLKKQWSGYFQRLLSEQRNKSDEIKQIDRLNEQFEELKTAILTSIENVDQRGVAKGIVKYRRMLDILLGLRINQTQIDSEGCSLDQLLRMNDIIDVLDFRDICPPQQHPMRRPKTILLKQDNTFYEMMFPIEAMADLSSDWEGFKRIETKSREIITEAIVEMFRPSMFVRYNNRDFNEYVDRLQYERIRNTDEE